MVIDDQGNRKIVYPKPPSGAGSVAQAAAAAVSAPSGSGTTAIPGEGVYKEQQALAQKAYDEAINGLQAQRKGIFRQYGFNEGGQVDLNNPIGLYQQLRRNHALDLDTADEDRISRGLSASGLGRQMESNMRYDQDVEDANFSRDYLSLLQENDQGQLSAKQQLEQALLQARAGQIQAALQAQAFTPGVVGPSAPAPNAPPPGAIIDVMKKAPTKKVEQPWERALRLRSEALERQYGMRR